MQTKRASARSWRGICAVARAMPESCVRSHGSWPNTRDAGMQLDLAFDLPFPRGDVWPAFGDVGLLVSCLPGATLRSAPDERPLRLNFAVKLGPISTNFAGEGDLVYGEHAGTLSGSGADR